MAEKEKLSNAALYWVIGVIAVSMAVFVYIFIGDAPKTLPKIKLSYFADEQEIADSVSKRLFQEINKSSFYWLGVEPEKNEQIDFALRMKIDLDKIKHFNVVIADRELQLKPEVLQQFGVTDVVAVKEQLVDLGAKLSELEKNNESYFLLTAAIYSTSLLPQNPLHKLKEKYQLKPLTFSIGYFAAEPADENKLLFRCDMEDNSGIKEWGCFVVNKARSSRRRLELQNTKPWIGLMDLTGETDYALLLKKK